MTHAATVAAQIAALEACLREDVLDRLRGDVAYDGPEPVEERVPDWDADRRAEAEQDRRWRQWP